MKITKTQLKQIIKEQLGKVSEGRRQKGRDHEKKLAGQMELRKQADERANKMGWPAQVRFDNDSGTYWIQNAETQEKMWSPEEAKHLEESKMKITKIQLKQIIKEELGRVLNEEGSPNFVFKDYMKLNIGSLEMKKEYDQVEVKLKISEPNSGTFQFATRGAWDIDSLADEIITALEENNAHPIADEDEEAFKYALEELLEKMGADPEEAEENSYDLSE